MSRLAQQGPTDGRAGEPLAQEAEARVRRWRSRLLLFMGGAAALLAAGNLIYATASFTRNDRSYCLTCHGLERPAAMWEPSALHAEGMACFPCHGVLPGREAPCGTFSAHPDTVNPNCIGCHAGVMEGRPIGRTVEAWRGGGVPGGGEQLVARWDLRDMMYTWHVGNRVCLCTDCHRNVAHDVQADARLRNRPRMAYCAECHYHRAKDDYARVHPLPELRTVPSDLPGGTEVGAVLSAAGEAPAVPPGHVSIYQTPPRPYHRKGESAVRATGKECRDCHVARYYPQQDFFGWEHRKKWTVLWVMFSAGLFVAAVGIYSAVSIWSLGRRPSLHRAVHWPSALRAVFRDGILGERIRRHSRLRWAVFLLVSVAFLLLAAVFGLIVLQRFVLPADLPGVRESGPVLKLLADLLGGCILAGTLLALYRRVPGRKDSVKSDVDDLTVLLLLLSVIATGFFLEACRLAVVAPAPELWFSFLGYPAGRLLARVDLPWTVVRFYVWHLHAVLVFALLAYLPFSKLFHLLTAPVSIAATASEAHYRKRL